MPLLIILAVLVYLLFSRKDQSGQDGGTDPGTGLENLLPGFGQLNLGAADSIPPTDPITTQSKWSGKDGLDNVTQAIANLEGFGVAGNRPTRDNNPGDLKYAANMVGRDKPGSNGIAQFADVGDGWDALTQWVTSHIAKNPQWDFYDMAHFYATGSTTGIPVYDDGVPANPDNSADYIASYVGVDPTQTVSSVIGGN